MKNKRICAVITLLCFLLTLMPVAAFAADEITVVASGTCGENAPSVRASTFFISKTMVQTKEYFDIELNLNDDNGTATNCTTTLYVWATKPGKQTIQLLLYP